MAALSSTELSFVRRSCQDDNVTSPVDVNKTVMNAAIQAIEDWYESQQSALSTLINTATFPTVLTAGQKKRVGKAWLLSRFTRGN